MSVDYRYKAKILRVVDGDTVDVLIDLGFNIHVKERLRLAGIHAPATRTTDLVEKEKGFRSKDWLEEKLAGAVKIIVETRKVGKYGRYIATIYADGEDLNKAMVDEGLAELYY